MSEEVKNVSKEKKETFIEIPYKSVLDIQKALDAYVNSLYADIARQASLKKSTLLIKDTLDKITDMKALKCTLEEKCLPYKEYDDDDYF